MSEFGAPPPPTYTMYSEAPFKVTLQIMGKEITFLADSGATLSLIRAEELPSCKKSGRYIYSIEAGGTGTEETLTMPLSCIDYGDETSSIQKQIKQSFILSEVCPINLLGRDLLLAQGLNLVSTPDGFHCYQVKIALDLGQS